MRKIFSFVCYTVLSLMKRLYY